MGYWLGIILYPLESMQRESEDFRQLYTDLGLGESELRWSRRTHNMLISGESDFSSLAKLRNVILSLRREWSPEAEGGIQFQSSDLGRRLQLAESEIDGLLRRQITCSVKDSTGGERVLDYSSVLN